MVFHYIASYCSQIWDSKWRENVRVGKNVTSSPRASMQCPLSAAFDYKTKLSSKWFLTTVYFSFAPPSTQKTYAGLLWLLPPPPGWQSSSLICHRWQINWQMKVEGLWQPQRESEEPPAVLQSSSLNNPECLARDPPAQVSSFWKHFVPQHLSYWVIEIFARLVNNLRRPSLAQARQRRRGHSCSSRFL